MRHEARQVPSWLIFDVGQNMQTEIKSLYRFITFFLCLISLATGSPPGDIQKRLESWLEGKPGGIALAWVDRDGSVLACAGQYALDDARQIAPDTRFSIGSVSKVLTTLLLTESERRGLVRRSDSAASYLLSRSDPRAEGLTAITLITLATHRAGLPISPDNFREFSPDPENPFSKYDRDALLAAFLKHGPKAPVGRAMVYSNFGVALLGQALARAWRMSYAEALELGVLKPLGMQDTVLALSNGPQPMRLAPDHVKGSRKENWSLDAFAPAGAACTSVGDMARLISAFLGYSESPLRGAIAESLKLQGLAEDYGCKMAIGWLVDDENDRFIAWHVGATAGSRAFIGLDLRRRVGVALLANSDQEVLSLAFELLSASRNDLIRNPPSIKNAADYVGTYLERTLGEIFVSQKDGVLLVKRMEWGFPLALRQISADRFAVSLMPAEIIFERNADGQIAAATTDLNGELRKASRVDRSPSTRK
jgi:CubicO group peptidase (beta-lactamase class C family)